MSPRPITELEIHRLRSASKAHERAKAELDGTLLEIAEAGGRHSDIGKVLGVGRQAVSERLRTLRRRDRTASGGPIAGEDPSEGASALGSSPSGPGPSVDYEIKRSDGRIETAYPPGPKP